MYEVSARTTFPYSAICYIQVTFADGYNARGSGVVVGNNDVLTAQHVVYDASHGGYATSITVTPGADSSPYTAPLAASAIGATSRPAPATGTRTATAWCRSQRRNTTWP